MTKIFYLTFIIFLIVILSNCSASFAQVTPVYKITDGKTATYVKYNVLKIPAGAEVELAKLNGPGLINHFYITDKPSDFNYSKATNFAPGLILKIYWDNAVSPSVNVPLSDFFGAFTGKPIDYETFGIEVQHFNYMCYLPMPFSKQARFVLANDGEKEYDGLVAYGIDYETDLAMAKEKSRLHCIWSRSNPTNGLHTLLKIKGKGHYIGNFLQVHSNYKGWWGEGDTNFYIDGRFNIHTPGTEDEYGSCWGFGENFSYNNVGYTKIDNGIYRMYRWYNKNPVRFQDSLRVEILNQRFIDSDNTNHISGQTPSQDDYISVSFWYQDGAKPVNLPSYENRIENSKATDY
jgi:hypothetical protein